MNGRGRWPELRDWRVASCKYTNRFSGEQKYIINVCLLGAPCNFLSSFAVGMRCNLSLLQDSGSDISVESCDSECVSLTPDEGEAHWDAIGRMSSVRRSSRFNRPRLISLTLRSGADGYGIQLEGRSPPTIASLGQLAHFIVTLHLLARLTHNQLSLSPCSWQCRGSWPSCW